MAKRHRPGWMPTLMAVVVVALTVAAGIWQTQRALYKSALQARYETQAHAAPVALPAGVIEDATYRYRRVSVTGQFDPAHEVWLDNVILKGVPGYQIITPLKLAQGNAYVLINRGWVARGADRNLLPEIKVPLGMVTIEGIAVPPSGHYLELSAQTVEGKVWQNMHFKRMQAQLPLRLQTLMVTQLKDNGDGLIRHWERPDTGMEKHAGYAFQWFSMAVATVVIYGVYFAKKRKST